MLALIVLLLFSTMSTSQAFDAGFLQIGSSSIKSGDTTHYDITVCALCRVTIDYLKSVYKIDVTYLETKFNETNGKCQVDIVYDIVNILKNSQKTGINPWQYATMIKTIASSNTKTDLKEMFEKNSHFDSESLIGGSQLILKRYQSAVDMVVREGNYDQARRTFGEMLHTLQDFYSHTNYIELEYTTPNEVLAKRIFDKSEFASIDMRTCISCTDKQCQTVQNLDETLQRNKLLTSGYFIPIGFDLIEKDKPKGKCSHGGLFDSTQNDEPTGGINKDKLESVHGHLHYRAAHMAYLASLKALNQLRQEITDENFALFLSLKKTFNSLIISIDTQCSMDDYVQLAKNISVDIVNQYGKLEFAPHNYILIVFNSAQAQMIVNSRNPYQLISAINQLNACQKENSTVGEFYYHGLFEGLSISEFASVIYTFTDSPAKDAYLKQQVRALLRSKRAIIYSFMGIKLQKRSHGIHTDLIDPLDGSDNDTTLASVSGGLTVPIISSDQFAISEFILRRLEWIKLQSIFMAKATSMSIVFYVDPSIDELYLDISSMGEISNISQIELRTPNNTIYPLNDSLINTKYLYMWKISKPTVGAWQLITPKLSQSYDHHVQIYGRSSLSCLSILQKEMENNTDSSGYTQLTTEPIVDTNLLVLTTCENPLNATVNISLISQSGRNIASYLTNETNQFGALKRISVPQESFRIQTILILTNGTIIQRIEKQLISPSMFSIESTNQPFVISPGETIQMRYTIKSAKRESATVRLQITDTLDLLGANGIERNVTFINSTSATDAITLPKSYQSVSTLGLVIFSLTTQNNQTNRYSYENDETASIYIDIRSASASKALNYYFVSLLTILKLIFS